MGQHPVNRRRVEQFAAVLHRQAQPLGRLDGEEGQVELRGAARRSSGVRLISGECSAGRGTFCRANMTWNSGERPDSRSGCNASTSRSKGMSWCA